MIVTTWPKVSSIKRSILKSKTIPEMIDHISMIYTVHLGHIQFDTELRLVY